MNQTELAKHKAYYDWYISAFNTRTTYLHGRRVTGSNLGVVSQRISRHPPGL